MREKWLHLPVHEQFFEEQRKKGINVSGSQALFGFNEYKAPLSHDLTFVTNHYPKLISLTLI